MSAQVFDPFLPKSIPFHVRGQSVKDGFIVQIDYVTRAANGFEAIADAQAIGLCRVVASPVKVENINESR